MARVDSAAIDVPVVINVTFYVTCNAEPSRVARVIRDSLAASSRYPSAKPGRAKTKR